MPRKTKPLILVVEDDAILRRVLCYKLRLHGYEVAEATDGEEGFEAMKKNPALVMLDMYMPNADGFYFLRKLADDPVHRGTPVIVVTVSKQKGEIASQMPKVNILETLVKSDMSLDDVVKKVDAYTKLSRTSRK